MRIALLGPGGVGGLLAGALGRVGVRVVVVARESTAEVIGARGLHVRSVSLGEFTAHPQVESVLREPVDVLIVATKAAGLHAALERIEGSPALVLPLLNGLDHLRLLHEHFGAERVLAGAIRVEADRPEAGEIVHSSPFLLVDMAFGEPPEGAPAPIARAMGTLARTLEAAGVPTRVLTSEAEVMWSKLVRLNALACTTSAYDKLLGEIRSTPALRADLQGAIEEGCEVGRAEGAADVDPAIATAELEAAHATLGSSMQRDIASGRTPELDAIPGAVLRAGARHGIRCPTIERLTEMIAARAGVPVPLATG